MDAVVAVVGAQALGVSAFTGGPGAGDIRSAGVRLATSSGEGAWPDSQGRVGGIGCGDVCAEVREASDRLRQAALLLSFRRLFFAIMGSL